MDQGASIAGETPYQLKCKESALAKSNAVHVIVAATDGQVDGKGGVSLSSLLPILHVMNGVTMNDDASVSRAADELTSIIAEKKKFLMVEDLSAIGEVNFFEAFHSFLSYYRAGRNRQDKEIFDAPPIHNMPIGPSVSAKRVAWMRVDDAITKEVPAKKRARRVEFDLSVDDEEEEEEVVALPESSPDLVSAISSISSYSLMATEEKFSDYMAALHYNCTLSAYKMGRTSYFKLFTVLLESPLTGVCRLLPSHGMILVTTHYRIGAEDVPGGLASYRMVRGTPHVVPLVAPRYEKDWRESLLIRLPFASSFAYISSLSVDATESRAVGVSTTGDIFLFSLPSLSLLSSLSHVSRVARPRAAVFVHSEEMGILFSSGRLIRCPTADPEELMLRIAEGDQHTSEVYSPRTQLVVPSERELFVIQSEGGQEVAISSQRSSLAARLFMLTIWRSMKQLLGMAVGQEASPLQQATQLLSLEFSLWHAPIVTLEEVLERTMRRGDFARAIQLADTHPEIEKDSVYKRQWMEVCGSGRLTKDDVKNILVDEGILLAAPLPLRVRLAHHGRILAVMEDVEMYLEMREWPLLKVAEGLAERGSLVALERLLLSNWSYPSPSSRPLLSSHSLSILNELPSSIEPKRYESLVPTKQGTLVVESALSSLSLTGPSLLAEIDKLIGVMGTEKTREKVEIQRVRTALDTLGIKNVHPTFGKLIASQTDKARESERGSVRRGE